MKFKLLSSVIASIMLGSMSFAASASDIVGTYKCQGDDPTLSPSAFTQKIIIIKKGNAYPIIEEDSTGKVTPYNQFGVLTDNVLSIAWRSTEPNSLDFGVQVFQVSRDAKTLKGPFIYWDKFEKVGMETCEKLS